MIILERRRAIGKGASEGGAFFRRLRFTWPALGLMVLLPPPLPAQQREPAIEVFALTGSYFHGNQSVGVWSPQFGAGVVVPFGRLWAAFFDVTTSGFETFWKQGVGPGPRTGPNDIFIDRRLVVLTPSIVGMWRRERFSLYVGGGVGFENEHERVRRRPIVGHDEDGQPILADEFQHINDRGTLATAVLRGGAIVSLTRRTVLRAEYSLLPKYIDERGSRSVTVGFGVRF